ncbi:MAG TPA: serine hydrolase domain-containing protein [Actinomycetota bacterium]|nr:serine hydrolase domain-containing protein [Actinomycetota bacterium]
MEATAVLDHVAAWIERDRSRFVGPALVVGVTDREDTLGTLALGDSAPGEPARDDHLWQIASVSKSFTAALVMQEAAAGTLSLDDPMTRFLPWFTPANAFAPITLHHLLTHTGGIATGWDVTGDAVEELLLLAGQEVASAPGSYHVYSNAGYKALGLVVETVAGRPWWDLVRERILAPLGMDATEPVISNDVRPRLATGWVAPLDDRPWHPDHGLVPAPWFESYTADGTICSNASDLCAYVRMYLHDGGDVLRPEDVERMTRGDVGDPETGTTYGYGLWVLEHDGHRLVGHSGSLPGYRSMMTFDRERGLGACVMTNGAVTWEDRVDLLAFAIDAAAAARGGGELPALPERSARSAVDPARAAGRYADGETTIAIEADPDGGLALVDGTDPRPWYGSRDAYVSVAAGWDRYRFTFERDGDEVVRVVHGARVFHREGTLVLPPPPVDPAWATLVGRYRCYGIEPMHVEVLEREGRLLLVNANAEEEDELVPLGDGRFRVGAEPWMPGRARFEAPVGDAVRRLILDGAVFVRVP